MTTRPKWMEYIRVQKVTTLGSSSPPRFVISFGPRNTCMEEKRERDAEMLAEEIKCWLMLMSGKGGCARCLAEEQNDGTTN